MYEIQLDFEKTLIDIILNIEKFRHQCYRFSSMGPVKNYVLKHQYYVNVWSWFKLLRAVFEISLRIINYVFYIEDWCGINKK